MRSSTVQRRIVGLLCLVLGGCSFDTSPISSRRDQVAAQADGGGQSNHPGDKPDAGGVVMVHDSGAPDTGVIAALDASTDAALDAQVPIDASETPDADVTDAAVDGGGDAAVDGGGDAAVDGSGDAAVDGGGDAAVDGGGDAAVDGGGDAAVDGGGDAAVDGGGDAAVDGGGDAGDDAAVPTDAGDGSTGYCGDGLVQAGEECDDPGDMRCNHKTCKIQCDTIYITYDWTSVDRITNFLGVNGSYTTAGGTLIMALPAGKTGPTTGTAGAVYWSSPIHVLTTNVTITSGTQDNRCLVNSGTLAANGELTWADCPYVGAGYGTTTWTPDQQQVKSGKGPGCMETLRTGTTGCMGNQQCQWDQPSATFVFSNAFQNVQARGAGTPTPGPSDPDDSVEAPDTATGRSWLKYDGVEVSRSCELKPTNCPAPGAQ